MSIFLYFHCITWLTFAETIVKVTAKKGKKTVKKTLTFKATVKNPTISAPVTAEVTVGATATVDANGVFTGVAEGTAKITATVKSGSAKKIASVTATSVKTLEVKFDGIVKDAATNMNKNSTVRISTNSNKTNTYFDMFVPSVPLSSIGDKIAVVAYLTTDVSVNDLLILKLQTFTQKHLRLVNKTRLRMLISM